MKMSKKLFIRVSLVMFCYAWVLCMRWDKTFSCYAVEPCSTNTRLTGTPVYSDIQADVTF